MGLRIAIVYDCLFPYTVGGGERWYNQLVEGLVEANAEVTYLTRRQWDEAPDIPGVRVVAVSGRTKLYDGRGKRRLLPTISFGLGLLVWMSRHRRAFDVVQLASFPFWSVLAVRIALVGTGTRVVVDWFEIWSLKFWRSYAGAAVGTIGYLVQRLCLSLSPRIIVLSPSNADRLRALGRTDPPLVLAGFLPSSDRFGRGNDESVPDYPPYVLFAGRHIQDKGVDLLPEAFAIAHQTIPELRFVIAGDGPLRGSVKRGCEDRGLEKVVDMPGFVSPEELERLMTRASCVVVPSRREGYGYIPVEAMGEGVPVITAGFDENLAVNNIEPGRNGFVADPPTPQHIADRILEVLAGGEALRRTTLDWYEEHATTRTAEHSVSQMIQAHADWRAEPKRHQFAK
jgi:glycosyltransferase involved in cell wall biosynthesis